MTRFLALSAIALATVAVAPAALAQNARGPVMNDWEITLSGSGSSDQDFDTSAIGLSGSVGKYVRDNVLVGVRQTLNFADTQDDNTLTGATRLFADYVFDMGAFRPFIGAGIGGIYGEGVNNSFSAGPEIGLKYYADTNTFLYVMTEYQFTFQNSDDVDEAFDEGGWFHAVGIGFNF